MNTKYFDIKKLLQSAIMLWYLSVKFLKYFCHFLQDQDPGVFDKATQDNMRPAVNARYNMLPYLYTLFFYSSMNGSSVARPLMFEYDLFTCILLMI